MNSLGLKLFTCASIRYRVFRNIRTFSSRSDFKFFTKRIFAFHQNSSIEFLSNNFYLTSVIYVREKHSKKKDKRNKEYDSDSEDEEEFYEEEGEETEPSVLTKDYKVLTVKLYSTRLDTVLKKCLNMSNKTVDENFYDSKIRFNGKKVLKKSIQLSVGDEVDLIIGADPQNENFLKINRIILKGIGFENKEFGKILLKIHMFKFLTVENYKDSWQARREDSD